MPASNSCFDHKSYHFSISILKYLIRALAQISLKLNIILLQIWNHNLIISISSRFRNQLRSSDQRILLIFIQWQKVDLTPHMPRSGQHDDDLGDVLEANVVWVCLVAFLLTPDQLVLVDEDDQSAEIHDTYLPILLVFKLFLVDQFNRRTWLHRDSWMVT
jgi:hypothetical protein